MSLAGGVSRRRVGQFHPFTPIGRKHEAQVGYSLSHFVCYPDLLWRVGCVIVVRDQRLITRIIDYIKLIVNRSRLLHDTCALSLSFYLLVEKGCRGRFLLIISRWDRLAEEHGQGLLLGLVIIQVGISRMCENLIKAILRRYRIDLPLSRACLLISTKRHGQLLSIIPIYIVVVGK